MKKIYLVLTHTGTVLSKIIKTYTKDEFSHVTINTIRKAQYKELKQILENIKRNEHFKFDYDNDTDHKTYTK